MCLRSSEVEKYKAMTDPSMHCRMTAASASWTPGFWTLTGESAHEWWRGPKLSAKKSVLKLPSLMRVNHIKPPNTHHICVLNNSWYFALNSVRCALSTRDSQDSDQTSNASLERFYIFVRKIPSFGLQVFKDKLILNEKVYH